MGMRLNAKKCYIMSINCKSTHYYTLCDHILKQVGENPYLGLTLTESLKWSSHTTKITKKAKRTLNFLRRNLKNFTQECRKTAYISLVCSILDWIYCVGHLSQTGYWETGKSTKAGSPFYNRWLQNARGGLCYWYASIIRAVIIGKSPLLEQAYLHVQGGWGASVGYTPKWVSKTNQTKTTSESEIFWKLWNKKHFGQAHTVDSR